MNPVSHQVRGHSFITYAQISGFQTHPPILYTQIMTSLWQQYIGIRMALDPPTPLQCVRTKWMAPKAVRRGCLWVCIADVLRIKTKSAVFSLSAHATSPRQTAGVISTSARMFTTTTALMWCERLLPKAHKLAKFYIADNSVPDKL